MNCLHCGPASVLEDYFHKSEGLTVLTFTSNFYHLSNIFNPPTFIVYIACCLFWQWRLSTLSSHLKFLVFSSQWRQFKILTFIICQSTYYPFDLNLAVYSLNSLFSSWILLNLDLWLVFLFNCILYFCTSQTILGKPLSFLQPQW